MAVTEHRLNWLGLFARHRVAANLLMTIMILCGVWALLHLNTQFFPSFTLEKISVRVVWRGASAEDVESGLTNRIEEALRTLDNLNEMTSTSAQGIASITLEFGTGTDMPQALDQVKEKVALIRDLPSDIEQPEINRLSTYDRVARILIWSEQDSRALPALVQRYERELLKRGIADIQVRGLAQQELAIEFRMEKLWEISRSLEQIGRHIRQLSVELPAGSVNRNQITQQLRSPTQPKQVADYTQLPIRTDTASVRLGDIADIERRPRDNQVVIRYQGFPAIEMRLLRTENRDSIQSAKILEQWIEETQSTLPSGIGIKVFDQRWQYIEQRIDLLLKNGLGGLLLIIVVLFFLLRFPVALWVLVGIPVSFMAALAALYGFGGSINMISLFALIMALGIIVDDAIVVGEDAMTHYQLGADPLSAAAGSAQRMFPLVVASSLTTIAAFLPLMLLGGSIGKLLFAIPLVVICVIIASLIESFLVLPGHLRHSFERMNRRATLSPRRKKLEAAFDRFRNGRFRHWVSVAVDHPWQTGMFIMAISVVTLGLLLGNRIPFTFVPQTESSLITANIQFTAGTPRTQVKTYLSAVEQSLEKIRQQQPDLINLYSSRLGENIFQRSALKGDRYASVVIELSPSDTRDIRNPQFIRMLRDQLPQPAALENLIIQSRQAGPGGRDLAFRLFGQDPDTLKQAAQELAAVLRSLPAVLVVNDDMPYGQGQLVYQLNAQGRALGITTEEIGRQLRAAYDGYLVQIFQDGYDEIEVRTILDDEQRNGLSLMELLPIVLPNGQQAALGTLVDFQYRRGFETLRHENGRLAVEVGVDIDEALGNANEMNKTLLAKTLPVIAERYGIGYAVAGASAEQRDTLGKMIIGSIYALVLVYLILAWVFSSYGWPLVVMFIIPFAIIGALLGHWVVGINLTVLSLFGLFGLAGIVVNDSIILVMAYRQLRQENWPRKEAIIECSVRRVRAVLLTSLTTIMGLVPLLFETSLQAQFLIPMATSIVFGLGFSTGLVLVLVPILLNIYEAGLERYSTAVPLKPTKV